jgi:hypothetical protein
VTHNQKNPYKKAMDEWKPSLKIGKIRRRKPHWPKLEEQGHK